MTPSKIIGTLFIIISLFIGYLGYNKIRETTKEVEVLGLEIKTANQAEKETGYRYIAVGAVLLLGGMYAITKSKK